MSSGCGKYAASSAGANGTGANGAATRRIGARSGVEALRAASAATSAPAPNGPTASWTMTMRPVFASDRRIAPVVQRAQRAQVEHLGVDAVLGQPALGRRQRALHRAAPRDERDVVAGARDRGLADRNHVVAFGHLSA